MSASGTSPGRFQNKENCNPIAIGIREIHPLHSCSPTGFSGLIGFSGNPQSQKEKAVCLESYQREAEGPEQSSEEGRPDLLEQKGGKSNLERLPGGGGIYAGSRRSQEVWIL